MSFHDRLAEAALRDGNTSNQFRVAAQRHANAFWVYAVITAGVWYFVGWAWAMVPLALALLSMVQSVSSSMTASRLESLSSIHAGPSVSSGPARGINLNDTVQVALVEEVRSKYSALLADEKGPYAQCMFKPESLLPYPKPVVRRSLEALLDFVEGRASSDYLDRTIQTPAAAEAVRSALAHLDDFVDVTAEELPTDPLANARAGLQATDRRGDV